MNVDDMKEKLACWYKVKALEHLAKSSAAVTTGEADTYMQLSLSNTRKAELVAKTVEQLVKMYHAYMNQNYQEYREMYPVEKLELLTGERGYQVWSVMQEEHG